MNISIIQKIRHSTKLANNSRIEIYEYKNFIFTLLNGEIDINIMNKSSNPDKAATL